MVLRTRSVPAEIATPKDAYKISKTKKAGREKKEGYGQHINPFNQGFCKIKAFQWPCVNFNYKQGQKELHEIQIWIVNLSCFMSRSHSYIHSSLIKLIIRIFLVPKTKQFSGHDLTGLLLIKKELA